MISSVSAPIKKYERDFIFTNFLYLLIKHSSANKFPWQAKRISSSSSQFRQLTELFSTSFSLINCPSLKILYSCLLYTSDAADEEDSVDLGGRRIIKKKK